MGGRDPSCHRPQLWAVGAPRSYCSAPMDPSPRKLLERREVAGGARFITFSCERRLALLQNPKIRDVFARSLSEARDRHRFEMFAWVVMPEHVHLLVRPREDERLDRALLGLKLSVAQRVIRRWRELDAPILAEITRANGLPRFWQKGGGFDRNVRDAAEFSRHVRYIHRNPVERGLVSEPADWSWSSLGWWLGDRGCLECDPSPDGLSDGIWKGFV